MHRLIIKCCWFFFQFVSIFAEPLQSSRSATPVAYPPISFDEILVIGNRPWVNVYESLYDESFCDDTDPVLHLSTNDIKMFFANFVPSAILPHKQIVTDQRYLNLESRGVIITKENHCYYWRLQTVRHLLLWDDGTNFCELFVTNDWTPTIIRKTKKEKLQLPSSQDILLFWNSPRYPWGAYSRIKQINIKRDEIVSFLDHNRTNRFVTRCDAVLGPLVSPEELVRKRFSGHSYTYRRDGGLLCRNNKVIFWELIADDKLFLEDEKGASCLLEKRAQ